MAVVRRGMDNEVGASEGETLDEGETTGSFGGSSAVFLTSGASTHPPDRVSARHTTVSQLSPYIEPVQPVPVMRWSSMVAEQQVRVVSQQTGADTTIRPGGGRGATGLPATTRAFPRPQVVCVSQRLTPGQRLRLGALHGGAEYTQASSPLGSPWDDEVAPPLASGLDHDGRVQLSPSARSLSPGPAAHVRLPAVKAAPPHAGDGHMAVGEGHEGAGRPEVGAAAAHPPRVSSPWATTRPDTPGASVSPSKAAAGTGDSS